MKPGFRSLRLRLGWGVLLLALNTSMMFAQNYAIDWATIDGGGGTSTNSQYTVSGTIGQPDAGGPLTGGSYSLAGGFWTLYAVQTPGAPWLSLVRSNAMVILSWPADLGTFVLQSKDNFDGANWSDVGETPVVTNGQNVVTLDATGRSKYYRLVSP